MEIKEKNYQDYIVYIDNISKSFLNGKIKANEDITLRVKQNDIYALMGENGAGKSTLMSILFGIYKQDEGEIYIRGKKVNFNYAFDAHREKIGMVHQHFKLVDEFTVHENIILGNEICNDKLPIKKLVVDKKLSKKKINDLIQKYNFNIDINKKVKNLNVSEKQKVEILKLLFLDSEILIFDEPTAILSKNEIKNFLQMLKNFKAEGKTIILITHKLDEVFEVANRGAVIRKGKFVSEFDIKSMDEKKISSLMVGREIVDITNKSKNKFGEVILSVKNLSINNGPEISFDVHRGEILSIAGISGNGQSELASLISGMTRPKKKFMEIINGLIRKNPVVAPKVYIYEKNKKIPFLVKNLKLNFLANNFNKKYLENSNLKDTTKMSIGKKYKMGLGFIPEDRQNHGLILEDSIAYNTCMNKFSEMKNQLKIYWKIPYLYFFKIINWKAIDRNAINLIQEYDVQGVNSILDNVGVLSGGNQQKLIVGRELSKEADLMILFQPTRGLDVGSIEMIHKKIIDAKEKNKAILLISYELSEIFALSDTIAVMSKNNIVQIAPASELNIEKVGELMTISKKEDKNE